ncbi:MAG: ATP-binding protein, partial [Bacteroidota bacterium]
QPVEDFLTSAVNWRNELKDNRRLIEDRISESFRLSNIYHTKQDFLPIPLQTSLRQLRLDESPFIARIEELYVKVRTRLQSWISRVEHEESLGLPEKIVRAVQSRQLPREGSNYSNIFLSRGFIGESFAVGRQEELRRIKKLINNWRLGYRGSVLLHGQRFSGKSLLGEWVASRYFDDHFVRLQPNATIEFNGRRQKVGTDLEEALAFVRKNSLNQRTLVWIDDLELWWSEEVPLLRNARSLMRYINQYGQSLFFLVATSNWVRQDLTCLLDWGQAFQAQINLDRMSFEDIHQAIMIRHGATHRTLVDDEGETVSSAKFEKMVKRVYQSVRANPGEAMMRWTLFTHNRGEDEVRHRYRNVSNLPDFLNPDQLIVLRILMMKKQATEYELRKMFGPAFKTKYSQHIQQLLSLGLLNRRLDGELEVNEYVVNDLGRSLEQRQVLRFNAR